MVESDETVPRPRIYIVDDDATMRLLMRETLCDEYDIEEFDNGYEVLQAVERTPPDMLLLDVRMPGISGFDVCSNIRKQADDAEVSIVIVTALEDSDSIERAFELGATDFINKPINWITLPYRIRYLLKARNALHRLKIREIHLAYLDRISTILTRSTDRESKLNAFINELLDIFEADHAFLARAANTKVTDISVIESASRNTASDLHVKKNIEEHIEIANIQRSSLSEFPQLSRLDRPAGNNVGIEQEGDCYQMIKTLQLHNGETLFLGVHKTTAGNPWNAAFQELLLRIGIRLSGVLDQYNLIDKLHHSERLLRQAQRIGHIGNWRWDALTEKLYWSDEVYRIYDCDPDVVTPSFDSFFSSSFDEDDERLSCFIDCILKPGKPHSVEHRIKLPNGDTRWVLEHCVGKCDESGSVIDVTGTVQDITERVRKQEKEVHDHKMEAIGQLTSGIAHDFGNLMTIAKGNLELLRDELQYDPDTQSENNELIEDALSAINDSVDLTKQLLTLSRKKSLKPGYLNVERTLSSYRKLLKEALSDKIEFILHVETETPDIMVDKSQFESALLNAVVNARDAMPKGGTVTITAGLEQVPVGSEMLYESSDIREGYVYINIEDNGTGMSEDIQQKAIEPFFTTKSRDGTGLGLSMIYDFMKLSGGALIIDSTPGKGTVVKLHFPVYGGKELQQEPEKETENLVPVSNATILIVEDRAAVRQFAVRCLNDLNMKILQAPDAETARGLLMNNGPIDLLFTDILMLGDMDGWELARWARNMFPDLQILTTTAADSQNRDKTSALSHDFPFLSKPYSKHQLVSQVCRLLAAHMDAETETTDTADPD